LVRTQTELVFTRSKLQRLSAHPTKRDRKHTAKLLRYEQQQKELVDENIRAMQEIVELRQQNLEANELLKQYCSALESMQTKVRSLAAQVLVYSKAKGALTSACACQEQLKEINLIHQ